jgi:hypothetical protein
VLIPIQEGKNEMRGELRRGDRPFGSISATDTSTPTRMSLERDEWQVGRIAQTATGDSRGT